MTGTNNPGAPVSKYGANLIDGMLLGLKWAETTITYSFPTSRANYGAYEASGGRPLETPNFSAVTAGTKLAVRFALEGTTWAGSKGFSVEGFTNLNINEIAAGSGLNGSHLRYGQTTMPVRSDGTSEGAYASFPGTSPVVRAGDVWFNDKLYADVRAGTIGWFNVIHETGHALGLKHPRDTYPTLPPDNPALNPQYDAMEYTIMSYNSYPYENAQKASGNGVFDYPQTFMMLDIRALQHMYGADFTTNSGATTYKWFPGDGNTYLSNNGGALQVGIDAAGDTIFATIWDGGGEDTYDLSAYATDLRIYLNPGNKSIFDVSQLAVLSTGGAGTVRATGNIYNALQYGNNTGSLIENARGGSGHDSFVGNDASNKFWGNAGQDAFNGLKGNDHYYGGAGGDFFFFVNSSNTAEGLDGRDTIWDFNDAGGDVIYLKGSTTLTSYQAVYNRMVDVSGGVEIRDTDGDVLVIKNMTKVQLGADDFSWG